MVIFTLYIHIWKKVNLPLQWSLNDFGWNGCWVCLGTMISSECFLYFSLGVTNGYLSEGSVRKSELNIFYKCYNLPFLRNGLTVWAKLPCIQSQAWCTLFVRSVLSENVLGARLRLGTVGIFLNQEMSLKDEGLKNMHDLCTPFPCVTWHTSQRDT